MKKGFTLIELLVVVLIIGILASVAVPQYQVAVAKTRLVGMFPLAKAIKESQERYYLANGEYSFSLENLDMDVPDCLPVQEKNSCFYKGEWLVDNVSQQQVSLGRLGIIYCPGSTGEYTSCLEKAKMKVTFYYENSSDPNKIKCSPLTSYDSSGLAAKVCKSMKGML